MPIKPLHRNASTPGRKPLFEEGSHKMFVRVSLPALNKIQELAHDAGVPMSTWARSVIMKELEK